MAIRKVTGRQGTVFINFKEKPELSPRILSEYSKLRDQLKKPDYSWSEEQFKEQEQIVKSALAQIETDQKKAQQSRRPLFMNVATAQKLLEDEQETYKNQIHHFESHLKY